MTREELIKEVQKYFKIQELVCQHCFNKFGNNSWQFISTELLSTLLALRTKIFCAPMTINTWANGGQFSQRGLRCNMCQIVKSKNNIYLSAHCLGKAIDFNVKDMECNTARNIIRQNLDKFEYPIRLESDKSAPTWIHIDTMAPISSSNKLTEFNG